jgi:hypothetical protein
MRKAAQDAHLDRCAQPARSLRITKGSSQPHDGLIGPALSEVHPGHGQCHHLSGLPSILAGQAYRFLNALCGLGYGPLPD